MALNFDIINHNRDNVAMILNFTRIKGNRSAVTMIVILNGIKLQLVFSTFTHIFITFIIKSIPFNLLFSRLHCQFYKVIINTCSCMITKCFVHNFRRHISSRQSESTRTLLNKILGQQPFLRINIVLSDCLLLYLGCNKYIYHKH